MDRKQLEQLADHLVADHQNLMDTLIALRHERGLSIEQVAGRMGVPTHAAEYLELDESNPTLHLIRRYAMAVGATITTTVKPAHLEEEG